MSSVYDTQTGTHQHAGHVIYGLVTATSCDEYAIILTTYSRCQIVVEIFLIVKKCTRLAEVRAGGV